MRSERADDPLIGVSCGHRVPRAAVMTTSPRGQPVRRYWCEECGAHPVGAALLAPVYRMSGTASTGEQAFDFLLELRDEISTRELVVDDPGTERGRAVVEAFGASVRRT